MARINYDSVASQQFAGVHNWNFIMRVPRELMIEAIPLLGENGELNCHCLSSSLPSKTLKMFTTKIRGILFKQPLEVEPETSISLTFYETTKYTYSRFFDKWMDMCFDRFTGLALPKNRVLVDGTRLVLQDSEGNNIEQYVLKQACPANVKSPELSGDPGVFQFSLDLNFTNYKRESLI